MSELTGDTESALLTPDGTHAWWRGSWTPLDPRAFSPDRQWVALEGEWRRVIFAPPAEGQAAPSAPSAMGLPQQTYPQGYPEHQQNYGPPGPGFSYAAGGPNSETNGFAIASLVLGIIWLGGLGSLLAVIFGHVARGQNKRTHRGGTGLATAGLVLGYIGLAIIAAFVITVVAVAAPAQAKKGYDASMKSDLRTVASDIESANVDLGSYSRVPFGGDTGSPGTTITGSGQSVGGDALTLSAGNTVTLVGANPDAFCLMATSSKSDSVFYYDSAAGGLTQIPCTAENP
jgi:hypothetical protein